MNVRGATTYHSRKTQDGIKSSVEKMSLGVLIGGKAWR